MVIRCEGQIFSKNKANSHPITEIEGDESDAHDVSFLLIKATD